MKRAFGTSWKSGSYVYERRCFCRSDTTDLIVDTGYRIDLLVEDLVVVELKAVQSVLPVHKGQLLSDLKLGSFKLGYLFNFHVAHMRDGITRMANGLEATASSASPPRPPR